RPYGSRARPTARRLGCLGLLAFLPLAPSLTAERGLPEAMGSHWPPPTESSRSAHRDRDLACAPRPQLPASSGTSPLLLLSTMIGSANDFSNRLFSSIARVSASI